PGKGRYAIYFRLNERAVFSARCLYRALRQRLSPLPQSYRPSLQAKIIRTNLKNHQQLIFASLVCEKLG
ncbi:hypothetical protein, partial [Paramuribaculum intestinale]|uniref:hypothetical protein n=1 Tax=Paramuribaculum intestinale TaxID=2094151 RepID=UPI0025B64C69